MTSPRKLAMYITCSGTDVIHPLIQGAGQTWNLADIQAQSALHITTELQEMFLSSDPLGSSAFFGAKNYSPERFPSVERNNHKANEWGNLLRGNDFWRTWKKLQNDFHLWISCPDLKHGNKWNRQLPKQKLITQRSSHINTSIRTFMSPKFLTHLQGCNSFLPPTVPSLQL